MSFRLYFKQLCRFQHIQPQRGILLVIGPWDEVLSLGGENLRLSWDRSRSTPSASSEAVSTSSDMAFFHSLQALNYLPIFSG